MLLDPLITHHFREYDAGRKNVGARIHGLTPELLRRHIGGRAGNSVGPRLGGRLGDAEIHHHHSARPRDHQVLGLQVPVHEPRLMDGIEPGKKLRRDLDRLFHLERTFRLQELEKRDAVDVFHRHELPSVLDDQIEDPANIGRDDFASRANFAPQDLETPLVSNELGRNDLRATSTRRFRSNACQTSPMPPLPRFARIR